MTNYKLQFLPSARKEWDKLDSGVKSQLKTKLARVLKEPEIPGSRLRGQANRYKIKLRASGYRLVYEVNNGQLVVLVIAIGKRDRSKVYKTAEKR